MVPGTHKFFWITPKWPLPAEDGARRATVQLLKSLTNLGSEIHLCAIVPQGETLNPSQAIEELGVKQVTAVFRCPSKPLNHLINLATKPLIPLTVSPYASKAVSRQIQNALAKSPGSTVVFDGLHAAGWLEYTSASFRRSLRKIYRAHNVESSLWVQGARKSRNPLLALFLSYQASRMRSFERKICRESILTAAVSRDDESGLQKLYGPLQTCNTPIGIDLGQRLEADSFPGEKNLLFIGRLDWQPNKEGLAWFLENVWPEAARSSPDLKLTVAGAGDGRWLERFSRLTNVRVLGRVPEVAPLYREAAAALAPVFFGSGTRVKAIEASAFARPCISTAIGVEGIGLEPESSYFQAESKEDWLRALREFDVAEARRRGDNARKLVEREFDPSRIASRFLEAVSGC